MVRRRRKAASPEFRREVVRMVGRGDKSIPEIEQDVGLTKGIIYRWVERYGGGLEDNSTRQVGQDHPINLQEAEAEMRRLTKALAQAEEERDILKKAVHSFSREQR